MNPPDEDEEMTAEQIVDQTTGRNAGADKSAIEPEAMTPQQIVDRATR